MPQGRKQKALNAHALLRNREITTDPQCHHKATDCTEHAVGGYIPVSSPVLFVCAAAPIWRQCSTAVTTSPHAAAVIRARPFPQSGPSPPNCAMGMFPALPHAAAVLRAEQHCLSLGRRDRSPSRRTTWQVYTTTGPAAQLRDLPGGVRIIRHNNRRTTRVIRLWIRPLAIIRLSA